MTPYAKNPEDCVIAYIAAHCRFPRGKAAFALTTYRIENGEEVERAEFIMAADDTTANERSIEALLLFLYGLQHDETPAVIIRSAMEYPLKGATFWRPDWKRRGWKTSENKPPTNLEKWVEIDAILVGFEGMRFSFQWVPPSAKDPMNAEAVKLAKQAVAA